MSSRIPHPGPQWSKRPSLLGNPGDPVACREITEDVSVHWWRNDDSGLCLCGKTERKR